MKDLSYQELADEHHRLRNVLHTLLVAAEFVVWNYNKGKPIGECMADLEMIIKKYFGGELNVRTAKTGAE